MTVVGIITVLAFIVVIDSQSSVLGGTTQDERLLSLQWYVGFITITGLTLAAALAERREASKAEASMAESLVASERRLQQSQKMEAVGQLAGGIAHDFNNILSAMSLQVYEIGRSNTLDAESRQVVRDLDDAVQRASTFTRRLLLFGRRQAKEERRVALDEIGTGLARLLARLMPSGISLSIKPSLAPLWIMADPSMIEQVVMNLVINARDAMPEGGQLTVSALVMPLDDATAATINMGQVDVRPGHYAVLRVSDTGHGIRPENLSRLFEPFFTTKEAGAGTGLGLSTVFSVAQEHSGYVRVIETSPAGTTFEFGVPLADANAALAMPLPLERSSEPTATSRLASARVLLVEDRDDVRRVIQRILERAGMSVACAADGYAGVAQWEEAGPFDLLITDLVMSGGMGGMQLSQELRARAPNLKVVYMSAYDPDLERYDPPLVAGVNYIPKPSSASQILQVVSAQLGD
jgi:signal transduction histidine kinase/ActR/RegA family two-component response regulator